MCEIKHNIPFQDSDTIMFYSTGNLVVDVFKPADLTVLLKFQI